MGTRDTSGKCWLRVHAILGIGAVTAHDTPRGLLWRVFGSTVQGIYRLEFTKILAIPTLGDRAVADFDTNVAH